MDHHTDYHTMTDEALLALLIGEDAASSLYRGALAPLFGNRSAETASLSIARELVSRWLAEELRRGPVFSSPGLVKDYLVTRFAGLPYESFVTLYLDTQLSLLVAEESFRGTLSQTSVYPREIVRRAISVGAGAVVFGHNHPSGVAEPSRADECLTQALKAALALVDVRVMDHIVVGGTTAVSLAERGLI